MKKIIAIFILLFLWMNATFAEVWWTITRSVQPNKVMTTQDKIYKKFANYSSESEFLKTEGQTCQVATDWCNTIMMWDWKFWGTTLMMCYWENGWEFKPQYSCIKYKWELSQNDQNQYDVFRKAVDKNFVSQLDKLVKMIAFIYDLQYKISFEILKEKDYFNKIIDRFDFKENQTKESILDMKKIGNEFINSKI